MTKDSVILEPVTKEQVYELHTNYLFDYHVEEARVDHRAEVMGRFLRKPHPGRERIHLHFTREWDTFGRGPIRLSANDRVLPSRDEAEDIEVNRNE